MTPDDEAMLAMHDAKMSVDSIATLMGKSPNRTAVRLHALLKAREAPVSPAPEPEVVARMAAPCLLDNQLLEDQVRAATAFPPIRQPDRETSTEPALVKHPPPTAYAGVTPAKLRYCRWFIAAGWRVGATAALFDVEPEDLREALAG